MAITFVNVAVKLKPILRICKVYMYTYISISICMSMSMSISIYICNKLWFCELTFTGKVQ